MRACDIYRKLYANETIEVFIAFAQQAKCFYIHQEVVIPPAPLCSLLAIKRILKISEYLCLLYNLKLIIHISGVLLLSVPGTLHLVGRGLVILLDATFAVATECVAAEIGVICVEIGLCFLCLFACCLWELLVFHNVRHVGENMKHVVLPEPARTQSPAAVHILAQFPQRLSMPAHESRS